jgi:carboxymethylenebutenolidase
MGGRELARMSRRSGHRFANKDMRQRKRTDAMAKTLAGAIAAAACAALIVLGLAPRPAGAALQAPLPERVTFMSADGHTMLVGYLFRPARMGAPRAPGVVMMHGRAGAYSSRANGVYDASTLSLRHKAWGHAWAEAGYVALLVDDFGPRGYPQGFGRFSYDSRPAELNEVTVRPLDAAGALAWLRGRADVIPDRIGLQGWSNGGSTVLATMSPVASTALALMRAGGFRAALAFYPGCGLHGAFDDTPLRPTAPTLVLHGTADEEVSFRRCLDLVQRSRAAGGRVDIKLYPGATHSFDSPARSVQKRDANAIATDDAIAQALRFFAEHVAGASRS